METAILNEQAIRLEPATNFDDIPLEDCPVDDGMPKHKYLCPVCKGHGSWNIELNAYGPGRHFQAGCQQCNGFGWVTEIDRKCKHVFIEKKPPEKPLSRFEHYFECECGRVKITDSSD